ncbi:MAG: Gmad2 immunoglobulin-like domain-containing protein [Anaerolineae bacterium]
MKRILVVLCFTFLLATVVTAQGSPYITITSPASGAVIPNAAAGVSVTGTAGYLNDVITVQAIDGNNQIVAQTTTNNPQPEGQWAASLQVSYTGPGRIVAYSGNNVTMSIDATAEVYVTFGQVAPTAPSLQPTALPLPASISINSPQNGSVADVTSGTLTVTGTAVNVFENNVIVQVLDAFSRVLVQTATTANASGGWVANQGLLIANGTQGSIRAYSESPADGSVMPEALVNVVFASTCNVRTDWPVYTVQAGDTLFSIATEVGSTTNELTIANCLSNPNMIYTGQQLHVPQSPSAPASTPAQVVITSPAANAIVNAGVELVVTGSTEGVSPGNTFLRALDPTGAVLAEQIVTVTGAPGSGPWTWQASLTSTDIPTGTRMTLYAYAVSPDDGSVLASAATPVSFGAPFPEQPFITITAPLPYAQLNDASRSVSVSGRGGNLVDVITVQAVNDSGEVMAEATTNNPQGADGQWTVSLTVPETRRGRIIAFSGNQMTQSIEAYAAVDVIFGDPTLAATYVLLNHPLPEAVITATQPYLVVAGSSRGVFSDRVFVNVIDENQNILLSAPAIVNPTTGTWSLVSAANAYITMERRLSLQVIATTPEGGVLAADRIIIETSP